MKHENLAQFYQFYKSVLEIDRRKEIQKLTFQALAFVKANRQGTVDCVWFTSTRSMEIRVK